METLRLQSGNYAIHKTKWNQITLHSVTCWMCAARAFSQYNTDKCIIKWGLWQIYYASNETSLTWCVRYMSFCPRVCLLVGIHSDTIARSRFSKLKVHLIHFVSLISTRIVNEISFSSFQQWKFMLVGFFFQFLSFSLLNLL